MRLHQNAISLLILSVAILLFSGCSPRQERDALPVNDRTTNSATSHKDVYDALKAASHGVATAEQIGLIVKSDLEDKSIYQWFLSEIPKEPLAEGWHIENVAVSDELTLGFGYRIPQDYDPTKPHPVLITLHGGVGTPTPYDINLVTREQGGAFASPFDDCETPFIVISPQGCRDAMWWTKNGLKVVLGALNHVKSVANVDTNRVFVIGFSDGGSAGYFLASAHPTPFTGFFMLNGHPGVARIAHSIYPHNMRNRKIFVCNTTEDSLYPPSRVMPFVERFKKSDIEMTFHMFPNIGHSPSYLDEIKDEISGMFVNERRNAWREKVEVAVGDSNFTRCDWLMVMDYDETEKDFLPDDLSISIQIPMMLGITLDTKYEGDGVRIAAVNKGSNAEDLMLRAGDVILSFNGEKIDNPVRLTELIVKVSDREQVSIVARRNTTEATLHGTMKLSPPVVYFSNDEMLAYAKCEKNGNEFNLFSHRAKVVRIAIRPGFVDMNEPIVVKANGEVIFHSVVKYSRHAVLDSYLRDLDPETVAAAYIFIVVP